MHTHPEKFHFTISPRVHKRPPRFFVVCSLCGTTLQAVKNIDGSVHAFTTNRKRTDKKMRSVRLTEKGYQKLKDLMRSGKIR